jgi:glycerol-3-phosphate acyltransferase PlsY
MLLIASALFLYLCGTIPCGLILGRLFQTGDIRQIGSGNIGATNMLRTGNKWAALLTLVGDFLKGFLPLVIVKSFVTLSEPVLIFFYIIPVLGHIYPIWLKFKGGKGVATGLGAVFAYSWQLGLACIAIWLFTAFALRISSLAALVAAAALPFINTYFVNLYSSLWLFMLALLIFYTHRDNIKKIMKGQETKIGASTVKPKRARS